ncbi:hypothetical protein B0H14DRAFT_3516996 [Mycena olivaceomarginata]|nr:hypothetical protein B0H14DRAFT_3516996 [Mycena olivaceomarginata]
MTRRAISNRRKRNRLVARTRDVYMPFGIAAADIEADRIARAAFMARVRAQLQQPTLEIDPSIVWTRTPSSWETGGDGSWGGWGAGGWGQTSTAEWGSGSEWGPEWGPSGGSGASGDPVRAVVDPSRTIRAFSQRNNHRGFARGPPSLIISNVPGPRSLSEIRKRYAITNDQHTFLEEAGGHSQMLAHVATLGEIEAYSMWREAQERATQAVLTQAERARRRRERKDAQGRAEYEKRRVMRVFPPVGIFRREGRRLERATPLTTAELYLNDARPPSISSPPVLLTCPLCFNLKSHPVSYKCGHSHCYVCIRVWLESSWACPTCAKTITAAPIPEPDDQTAIAVSFPGWDDSEVAYGWDGLRFPRAVVRFHART